ncbi:MAG: F0F1 ATP synthase subunit B [Candidatus Rokubacteria bacterium]|nr:F0F1 ATP synthase subunit B [Candidatus Rokubacteria bacterium]MBI3826798.1 F0F1 ATP synthase subunit B [Candidatus Rokubacteria bacterium]
MRQRGTFWLGGLVRALGLVLLALPVAALAAEEHGGGGGGLINLDKSLIIQAINFIILLVVLHRVLYKPFLAKMNERTEAIRKSLDEAQAARAQAAKQAEENAARLRQTYAEAAEIRERAVKEAGEEQRRLVEAARAESQRLVESARAQMDADIRRARDELRREVSGIAVAVAEKLVRRSLDDAEHRRIVDDEIAKIRA